LTTRPRILHLTKVPPSDSGIAHVADAFSAALGLLGDVTTVGLPLDAAHTQRPRVIARTARRTLRRIRDQAPQLVVAQLSGRALAEFYACVATVSRSRRPALWIVAHDPPSLVGPSLLVSPLDHKGGRRLGLGLSDLVGRPLERRLLARTEATLVLSRPGARSLQDRFPTAAILAVPLPVELPPVATKEPLVYVPARVTPRDVLPVLEAVAAAAPPYRLRIGSVPPTSRTEIEQMARRTGMAERLEFTGFLDDAGLDASYAAPAVVVRNRPPGGGNALAASGPIVSAMAAGCAVVSTDPRGSADCLSDGAGLDLSPEPTQLGPALHRLLDDPAQIARMGAAARAHIEANHAPAAVARRLRAVWEAGPRRP